MSTPEEENEGPLSLAPAAGGGIGKMVAASLLGRPDFVEELAQTALGGLRAVRSIGTRDGPITEPDYRVRVQTFFGLLAHMEGEPVKRVVHEIKRSSGFDPLAELQENPELRAAARHLLEKSEWRHSGRQDYKRPGAGRKVGPPAASKPRKPEPEIIDIDPEAPGGF
jgi:hypothetical protein